MMKSRKNLRMAESIHRAVSLIVEELSDPRVGFVTITRVEVSDDLKHAEIFFSVLGGEDEHERTLEGLRSARGFVRTELAHRVRFRRVPTIDFNYEL